MFRCDGKFKRIMKKYFPIVCTSIFAKNYIVVAIAKKEKENILKLGEYAIFLEFIIKTKTIDAKIIVLELGTGELGNL